MFASVAQERIAHSFTSYNAHATTGEQSLNLFTGVHTHPVRLVLEGEATDKIADSLSGIADAMAKKVN